MYTSLTKAAGRGRIRGRGAACAAFTLIELMVVMAIIIILAGMSIRFMSGSTETANRRKAESQLKAMELALDMFENEHGEYPLCATETEGAAILYQALSGDGNDQLGFGQSQASQGKLGSSHKPLLTELDPRSNAQNMVAKEDGSGSFVLIDPWGMQWRYLRLDTPEGRQTNQRNAATYDLWSEGGVSSEDNNSSEENTAKWIKNW